MKKAIVKIQAILFVLLINLSLHAQDELALGDLSFPIVPGERELRFSLPLGNTQAGSIEVWIFYAKSASELTNLNSNSFGSDKHYGRALMLKSGSSIDCHFVFPHKFHSSIPNADLFFIYHTKAIPNLVAASGFPIPIRDSYNPGTGHYGQLIPGPGKIDFNSLILSKDECVYYRVYKRVKSGNSYTDKISSVRKFRMPDSFNIGIAGDSYSAGEGAPDDYYEPDGSNNDMWISCRCHRSVRSGHLKGVKRFIQEYPETAIDYSFQACSGARTEHLFRTDQLTNSYDPGLALYSNNCGNVTTPTQFKKIRDFLITDNKHNEVNMILMSIGGNNTGFGDLVTKYLLAPLNLAAVNAIGSLVNIDVMEQYRDEIADLENDYADLDEGINDFFPEVKPIVALTNCPDPTMGPNGRCGCRLVDCALYENDCEKSPRAEYQLLKDEFLVPLNSRMNQEADRLNWNLINVSTTVGEHGLCNCDDPYFNTIGETYENQGDVYGVIHPNRKGYRKIYEDKTFNFLVSKYNEYRAGYQLAILFGIKEVPAECGTVTLRLGYLLSLLKSLRELTPVVRTLKGFDGFATELNNKELATILASGDGEALEKNQFITNLQANKNYKTTYNSLAIRSAIIKTKMTRRTLSPVKPLRPALLKIKNEVSQYVNSKEFQKQASTMKKSNSKSKEEMDPLDNLYNNKEN